jgi:hypothetical protein
LIGRRDSDSRHTKGKHPKKFSCSATYQNTEINKFATRLAVSDLFALFLLEDNYATSQ